MSGITSDYSRYEQIFSRLCHLEALSRTDNVEGVIDKLILHVFAIDNQLAITKLEEIAESCDAYFSIRLDLHTVEQSTKRLIESGELMREAASGKYRIDLHECGDIQRRNDEARNIEAEVKREWLEDLQNNHNISVDIYGESYWQGLHTYLKRVLLRHGAETVQLLDPDVTIPAHVDKGVGILLEETIREKCSELAAEDCVKAIRTFFKNYTVARTKYLAQLLDATFTFFSLTTDEATSEYLRAGLSDLRVFVDTNFIFGIVGLHSSPYADLSGELVKMVTEYNFPFTLYYHEETLREMEDTIGATMEYLRKYDWKKETSQATIYSGEFSGLELKYHERNAISPLKPEQFFGPYLKPSELLRERGFIRYSLPASRETWLERRAPVDKLADRYKEWHILKRGWEKRYQTSKHDASVWLTVVENQERQRTKSRSPLAVGALFLTCDYWFCKFVRTELRDISARPSVIMPSEFIQLLRPMIPRTDDFDRRFIEALSLPEFRTVKSEYVAQNSRILARLNDYPSLPLKAKVKILADDIVHQRIREAQGDQPKESAAVDQGIADALTRITSKYQLLMQQRESDRVLNEQSRQDIQSITTELSKQQDRGDQLEGRLSKMEEKQKDQSAELEASKDREAKFKAKLDFYQRAVLLIVLYVLEIMGLTYLIIGPWDSGFFKRLVNGWSFLSSTLVVLFVISFIIVFGRVAVDWLRGRFGWNKFLKELGSRSAKLGWMPISSFMRLWVLKLTIHKRLTFSVLVFAVLWFFFIWKSKGPIGPGFFSRLIESGDSIIMAGIVIVLLPAMIVSFGPLTCFKAFLSWIISLFQHARRSSREN